MKEKQISRRSLLYGSVVALSILGIAYAAGSPKLEELIAENKRRAKALEFCIQNECTDKVYNENLEAKAKIREEILKHQAFSDYRKEKQRLREKDAEPTKSLSELYSLIKTYGFNVFERKEHAEKLESVYLRGYSYTWAEENLQKIYEQNKGTLTQFIKKILGLYEFPEPEKVIEQEFKTFMISNNQLYNADQINFLRTLQTVFSKKKHIEYDDFFEAPFTNFGTNAPTPLFTEEQLKGMVSMCQKLEKELFVEA